jgi:hypothetical protein
LKSNIDFWASIVPELRSETFVPNVKTGGYGTDIVNEYPRRLPGPDLMLRFVESDTSAQIRGK